MSTIGAVRVAQLREEHVEVVTDEIVLNPYVQALEHEIVVHRCGAQVENEKAIKAAEELADEALGNGNDWELFCKPRLELIKTALAVRPEVAPTVMTVIRFDSDCLVNGFPISKGTVWRFNAAGWEGESPMPLPAPFMNNGSGSGPSGESGSGPIGESRAPELMQVSPADFIRLTGKNIDAIGIPIYYAVWPSLGYFLMLKHPSSG